jgi:hypothetical protein
MCPVCWATALASFSGLFVLAVITTAGSDRLSLVLAGLLGAASVLVKSAPHAVPWWCFVGLILVLAARVGYLLVLTREKLLAYRVWNRACQIASARCPRKKAIQTLGNEEY